MGIIKEESQGKSQERSPEEQERQAGIRDLLSLGYPIPAETASLRLVEQHQKEHFEKQDILLMWIVFLLLTMIVASGVVVARDSLPSMSPTSRKVPGAGEEKEENLLGARPAGRHRLLRVIDGDTVVLGTVGTVRLLGIDSPELHHPTKPPERCGPEAKRALELLLGADEGQVMVLLTGQGGPLKRDHYHRLLGYVKKEGVTLTANEVMVSLGMAKVYRVGPFKRKAEFLGLEEGAKKEKRGMWSDPNFASACVPPPGPVEPSEPPPAVAPAHGSPPRSPASYAPRSPASPRSAPHAP